MTAGLAGAETGATTSSEAGETLGLVGASPAMHKLRAEIRALGRNGFRAVLVQGESGVGKEVVAEALRLASCRANTPYEIFDCPAVPEDHLESELFGTMRGAFPGAIDKAGTLERAHGGIVFFDEIAAMRREHQAKVLRVIEGKGFRRVGGSRGLAVDVAVIAAAHENLASLAASGAFRHDLYYRLIRDGCLFIPPLRERPEDVALLVRHYLASFRDPVPRVEPTAMLLLMEHPWPGNVRQLQTALRMALRSCGDVLDGATMQEVLARFDDVGGTTRESGPRAVSVVAEGRSLPEAPASGRAADDDFHAATARMQRQLLLDAFNSAAGNKTAAGILLGFHLSPGEHRTDVPAITDARRNLALRKFRYWSARLGLNDTMVRGVAVSRRPVPS
ncbi:MAG: sigma 54-interacting transcriptional regulator [Myxococcales bacterium]|nr:sigma 54-interacting transcriptional regulator [Myxococcales bacterium]